ncbi:MAG: superoxide dismutase [Caldibacillus debilis]|uniref:Superoxide dismutase [Cu-Zn] n=1 Tax=Caldibacillus debilis TaxID=301148 RepID=A0A3E0K4Y9_9BACI|nr:superoxide dismutase family protein [Caldibacillus debilis]MBO2481638.1 superoxide dismutase [Bacillaceae bacterium]MBY6271799.1 superoxide dismutase [Bacillaceae bacterium]REJ17354.1 MAG: superoxide dismutase [Caldibacillus debilis]REJ28404.1 MAG: superoxide dismutase [Caldibacillus debilis]
MSLIPYYIYSPYPSQRSAGRAAYAVIKGGPLAPNLRGICFFSDLASGTEIFVEVSGLPPYRPASGGRSPVGPHGFHIHDHGNCAVGDPDDPFQGAGSHWNPDNQPHGNHPGDFPVLFSNHGYARMSFFTDRFRVSDIIGKSVIIHENPDDYRTQPAGNAGKRLACGVIRAVG